MQRAVVPVVEDVDELDGARIALETREHVAQAEHPFDRRGLSRARDRLDSRDHLVDHPLDNAQDDVVLGLEVQVERALRDPGLLHDVAHRGVGDAVAREHARSRRDKLGAAGGAVDDARGHVCGAPARGRRADEMRTARSRVRL